MTSGGAMLVGFRCDAGARRGVGHLVRCVALAEELVSRGVEVVFLGDLGGLGWAAHQLQARSLQVVRVAEDPEGLGDIAVELGLAAVVLDGYHLDPASGSALRARGVIVVAVVDGPYGAGQAADIYLDQNLGATRPSHVPPDATVLLGLDYVLLRDIVRAGRTQPRPLLSPERAPGRPSVLTVFGGTDSHGAALQIVPLLLRTGLPVNVTAVAGRRAAMETLMALPLAVGQKLHVTPPVDDLPSLVAAADLVVSASGTSVWEMLCLGAPTAVVCVTGNQEVGYRQVVAEGLAAPLGRLADLESDRGARRQATNVLGELLKDPSTRAALASRGSSRVDGRGRERVADALVGLSGVP